MKTTEILGRLARAKDRLSIAQKNTSIVFQFLVGREWGRPAAYALQKQQGELTLRETLDTGIQQTEEALHDLKILKAEFDDALNR